MTVDQLRRMQQAQPFRPFDLGLANGRAILVTRPDLMMFLPKRRTIVVGHADGTAEIVDVMLVTSLKERRNCSRRRRHS